MPKTKHSEVLAADDAVAMSPRARADRLYRAAAESVRQRQRYARLVENGAEEDEQNGALRIACICDDVLSQSMKSYESVAASVTTHRDEEWWHKANGLWHAGREYDRRHRNCDEQRKIKAHSPKQLAELAMEYDLEASALLALHHAVLAYKKAVPDVEGESPVAARVA